MILAYVSHQSQQMMFMLKKTHECINFYNSRMLFPYEDVASIALAVYTFTGIDTVGGLFGCGKFITMKRTLAANDTSMNEVLEWLGGNTVTDETLLKSLEGFTIKIIYKESVSENLSEARAHKWRKLRTSDSSRIPLDEDSFRHCEGRRIDEPVRTISYSYWLIEYISCYPFLSFILLCHFCSALVMMNAHLHA